MLNSNHLFPRGEFVVIVVQLEAAIVQLNTTLCDVHKEYDMLTGSQSWRHGAVVAHRYSDIHGERERELEQTEMPHQFRQVQSTVARPLRLNRTFFLANTLV